MPTDRRGFLAKKKKKATTKKERTKLGKTQRKEGEGQQKGGKKRERGEGRRKKRKKLTWLSLRKQESLLSETAIPSIELKDCLV